MNGNYFVFLVVYVGDIELIVNLKPKVDRFIMYLENYFGMRILERIDSFLGMTVEDSGCEVKLHKQSMIERVLKAFGMTECKPVTAPLPSGLFLSAEGGTWLSNSTPYRQMIGALIHVANTDMTYVVH